MSWYATIACVLFPVYSLFDVNWFLRSAFTILHAKTRKKIGLLEPATIYGFVVTNDIDFFLTHMNNARFLRELDFARMDQGIRNGFFEETLRRGGHVLLTSSFIRYRLPLPLFSRYKVDTSVVFFDEKNFYLHHKVVTLHDNIIRALIYTRSTCVNVNVLEIVEMLSPNIQRPQIETVPADYRKWMETLELSSKLMKASRAKTETAGGKAKTADGKCTVKNENETKDNGCKVSPDKQKK